MRTGYESLLVTPALRCGASLKRLEDDICDALRGLGVSCTDCDLIRRRQERLGWDYKLDGRQTSLVER